MNGTENRLNGTTRERTPLKGTNRDKFDHDPERGLLSCIMLEPRIIKELKASSDDFIDPKNRYFYQIMSELVEDGIDVTPANIHARLDDKADLKFLVNLDAKSFPPKIYQIFDQQIIDRSIKQKAAIHLRQLLKMSENGTGSEVIIEKISELQQMLVNKAGAKRTLISRIEDWISRSNGVFFGTELDKDLGIGTNRDKENRKKVLQRLEKKGRIVKASNRQSHYRIVDDALELIDYKSVQADESFEIKWPFEIERLVRILPKSIIICAGAWEAGKTAFLLNVARMNMVRHQVRYMSSEMGDAEFALRLNLFVDMAPDDWQIEAIERSSDWEDAILPDAINIIDYLELSDAFYNVGDKIRKIFDRLRKGIAVIAIQKGTGKELGRGGDFTAEKARLYLSLDPGELTIIKGKLWANPQVSPKNMCMKFKLWQGHKFVPQGEWFKKVKQAK